MKGTDLPTQAWVKSSHSNVDGACVEVARLGSGIATRDSKDPAGPALVFAAEEWNVFVGAVREGEFQLP